jgi:hypothetical protein
MRYQWSYIDLFSLCVNHCAREYWIRIINGRNIVRFWENRKAYLLARKLERKQYLFGCGQCIRFSRGGTLGEAAVCRVWFVQLYLRSHVNRPASASGVGLHLDDVLVSPYNFVHSWILAATSFIIDATASIWKNNWYPVLKQKLNRLLASD